MERLTKRSSNGTGIYNTPSGDPVKWENNRHKVLQKLTDYEDLEEQSLLLKLPFKVGDTVYYISEGVIEPCTVEVIFLSDYIDNEGKHSNMAEIHYDRKDCPYVSTEIYFSDIGKTVFLTQNQAEEALNSLQSEVEEVCFGARKVKDSIPYGCVRERSANLDEQ